MSDSEKVSYLIEKIKTMTNAVDNQTPSMLLLELRRVAEQIECWEKS